MINSISYYVLLFLIIIFYCVTLVSNIKKSPKRIKVTCSILIVLAIIKNVAIIGISFLENPSYINICKIFCFSNLVYVPSLLLVIFYIFLRKNEFNFNIIIGIIVAMAVTFLLFVTRLSGRFIVFLEYGYVIDINKNIFSVIFIGIIASYLIVFLFSKKYSRTNNKGILGITVVSVIFILEYLIFLCGFNIYPYVVIGEMPLIGLMYYGIEEFKSTF